MKIIDASALVEVLIGSPKAERLAPTLDDDLFAPELLISEVISAFRGLVHRRELDADEATSLVDRLVTSEIEYLRVWPHTHRIWELRHTLSAYDACYVALAEELRAPLVTTDLRLARAVEGIIPVIAV